MFARVLHLEIDIEGAKQRTFGEPQRETRVLEVDIRRDFVALRGNQLALELEQIVGRRHPDAEADLLITQ
jgi:hypothetical protein